MKFERGKPDRSLKIGSYSKFKSHLKMEMENILYPLSLSVVSTEEEDSTIDIRSKKDRPT